MQALKKRPTKCLFLFASFDFSLACFFSIRQTTAFLHSPNIIRMTKHSSSSNTPPPKTAKQAKLSSSDTPKRQQQYKIFCDLDGVLCDFDAGFQNVSGKSPNELKMGHMWAIVAKADSFYEYLPWMNDGKELWKAILPLNPDVLTGVPRHYQARYEKAEWCRRELGVETNHVDMAGQQRSHTLQNGMPRQEGAVVNVITCWSRNKHEESGFNCVLIDDRESLQRDWEERGGIFIHHTSTERTLKELRDKGILPLETDESDVDNAQEEKKQEKEKQPMLSSRVMYTYGGDEIYPDTP